MTTLRDAPTSIRNSAPGCGPPGARRSSARVAGLTAALLIALGSPAAAAPGPDDTVPAATTPPATEAPPVDTTVPDEPGDDTDDTVPPTDTADDGDHAELIALGIVGFVIVLAIAAWWMIRHDDPDRQPLPPSDGWGPGELP